MSLEAWLSRGKRTILVIEDDPVTCKAVEDFAGRHEALGVVVKNDGR